MSIDKDTSFVGDNYVRLPIDSTLFYPQDQFALINADEVDKISDFKNYVTKVDRMNSSILFLVLSYIRLKMLRRDDKQKVENKPEIYYRNLMSIAKDIDITERQVGNAIRILNELDIIYSKELPRYKDDEGNWHSNVTIFVNKYKYIDKKLVEDYDYQKEYLYGSEFVLKSKYRKLKTSQQID